MRSLNGPRWLIVYCSDFKCSHSVVIDAAQWADEFACPTWSRSSPARPAVATAPMSGRCSRKRAWERNAAERV
jgi:hypothetical protein